MRFLHDLNIFLAKKILSFKYKFKIENFLQESYEKL